MVHLLYWRERLRPFIAIAWNRPLPYFFRPIAAATAPGLLTPPRLASLDLSAAKRPPPPGFIDFLAILSYPCIVPMSGGTTLLSCIPSLGSSMRPDLANPG